MADGPADSVFVLAADAVRSALPDELADAHVMGRRWAVKVWFGPANRPAKEHYEAQMVNRRHIDGKKGFGLEIGFHAEHSKAAENDECIERILAAKGVKRALGKPAEAGEFLGNETWRRISEVWIDPDLSEPDVVWDIADRLATYIETIEPVR